MSDNNTYSKINEMNQNFDSWKSDYLKTKDLFIQKDINDYKKKILKDKLKEFQIHYNKLRSIQNLLNELRYEHNLDDIEKKNAESLYENLILEGDTIQFQFLTPITLRLNDFSNSESIKRDFLIFLLGIVFTVIYSNWDSNESTSELNQKHQELINHLKNIKSMQDTFNLSLKDKSNSFEVLEGKLDSLINLSKRAQSKK